MPIGNNDCYGQKKYEIINNYYLHPIGHIVLLDNMSKEGCCGTLTNEFYIFYYTKIDQTSDNGTFFVGADCAKQIIEKIDSIKKKAGKPPIQLPQTFDISIDGGFVGGKYNQPIKSINHDALILLLLLSSVWEVKSFYGSPANILRRIALNPMKTLGRKDLLKILELIEKAKLFDTIKSLQHNGKKIGHFSIPYFNTIIDFIQSEQEYDSREHNKY